MRPVHSAVLCSDRQRLHAPQSSSKLRRNARACPPSLAVTLVHDVHPYSRTRACPYPRHHRFSQRAFPQHTACLIRPCTAHIHPHSPSPAVAMHTPPITHYERLEDMMNLNEASSSGDKPSTSARQGTRVDQRRWTMSHAIFTGNLEILTDLKFNEAIILSRQALNLYPSGHPHRSLPLYQLARSPCPLHPVEAAKGQRGSIQADHPFLRNGTPDNIPDQA
jgi:hypothetical protein